MNEPFFDARSESIGKQPNQRWQERLLPLMVRMIVALSIFFFVTSFAQLVYLHSRIGLCPAHDPLEALGLPSAIDTSSEDGVALAELRALVALEASVLELRYHQANVLLMSRIWSRYLGFVTGMILALVGAAFILGKLQEQPSEITSSAQGLQFTLRTASPGLLLVALGVALMITTIVTHHEIETRDVAVFLRDRPVLRALSDSPKPEFD
ncbi:hypothetical protein KAW64_10180 [bacterium]|nr:hypothetical protein [bacterium]